MEKIDLFEKGPPGTVLLACLEGLLENAELRNKLGIGAELHTAILQNPKAIELLAVEAQQKLNAMIEKTRFFEYGKTESIFDLCFSPDGDQLFLAGDGMKVIDWQKILSSIDFVPAPEFFVEAPKDDEKDPNSHPLAYGVRFDAGRNLLLSCCLAGVVQYLNIKTGHSGVLLKIPDVVTIWRVELTRDKKALVCYCADRPVKGHHKGQRLQIWNYPALCQAAGLG